MDINEKILQELVSFKGEFSAIHSKLDDVVCRISSVEKQVTSIEERVVSIEEKVDEIKEELDMVHGAVNEVGKWCEQASDVIQVPYMKKAQ